MATEHLGFKPFNGWEVVHLMRFLYARMLVSDERPTALFDHATRRLTERQVILPGARVLERLEVRDHVTKRLYRTLSKRIIGKQAERLDDLLIVPEGERRTPLERLRTPSTRTSSPALVAALERIEAIRALGVSQRPAAKPLERAQPVRYCRLGAAFGKAERRAPSRHTTGLRAAPREKRH